MSTTKLTDPGDVVTFERGAAHVLVEHEGALFLVPKRLVEPEPDPTPRGACTVVSVDRKAGEVTLTREACRAAGVRTGKAPSPEAMLRAIYGRASPMGPLGSNRKARRAARRGR